jgi:AraC-like DNA-binding protein
MRILNLFAAVTVISGQGIFESTLTGKLKVNTGDVILLFPDCPARYGSKTGWQTEWIVWQGREADSLVRAGYFSPDRPVISDNIGIVHKTIQEIKDIIELEGMEAAYKRKLLLQEMLLSLYRSLNRQNSRNSSKIINTAVEFIERNSNRSISVGEIAKKCRLSEVHFRRLFKASTGIPPKDFILNRKIAEAKRLISRGIPIKEIAEQLAFCDEFHLRKAFRKITGIAPGKFL